MPKFKTIRNGGYENPLQLELIAQMIELQDQLNSLPQFVSTMKETMTRRGLTMAQAIGDQLTMQKMKILADRPHWEKHQADIEVSVTGSCVSLWGSNREIARLDIPAIKFPITQKQQA